MILRLRDLLSDTFVRLIEGTHAEHFGLTLPLPIDNLFSLLFVYNVMVFSTTPSARK